MKNRPLLNFLIFWAGQFLSSLGSSMTGFAITIWIYTQTGNALSLSLSNIALMVPRMVCGLLAGPLVERMHKKRVLLYADLGAGLCTLCMLGLFASGRLVLWHIYLLNALTSVLGSFQSPAAAVTVSRIVPKSQYTRAGGLEAFKNGTVQILSPVLAAALLAAGGMGGVFLFDLASLALACVTLLFGVRLPEPEHTAQAPLNFHHYLSELRGGFGVIRRSPLLKTLLAFFAFINLVAGIAYYCLLSPMILAKTGGNQNTLAFVNGMMGLGGILGGLAVTAMPAPRRKCPVVFGAAALSFLFGDVLFALGNSAVLWSTAGFLSSFLLPFLDANETYLWRTGIPLSYQSRAFSFKYAFQAGWIPVGIFLGGLLADRVFEPFMATAPQGLSHLFGHGPGSGMALIFFLTGTLGMLLSLWALRSRPLRQYEGQQEPDTLDSERYIKEES